MSKALIPGSFDPITNGHLDIIKRACSIFEEITILVSKNPDKKYLLSDQNRLSLTEDAVKDIKNATCVLYDGLLVDFMAQNNINVIIKGLRNDTDYAYENSMALTNMRLSSTLHDFTAETLYMPTTPGKADISSSLVRLLLSKNADISSLVPNPNLLNKLLKNQL